MRGVAEHLQSGDIVPVDSLFALAEVSLWRALTGEDIRSGTAAAVGSGVLGRTFAINHGDGETLSGTQLVAEGIGVDVLSGVEREAPLMVEGQVAHGLGVDAGVAGQDVGFLFHCFALWRVGRVRDIHSADVYGSIAEMVAELHAQRGTAHRHVDDLTGCSVGEAGLGHVAGTGKLRCGSPCSFPPLVSEER